MNINNLINTYKPTTIGANPKTGQKSEDINNYAKSIDGYRVTKSKTDSGFQYQIHENNDTKKQPFANIYMNIENNKIDLFFTVNAKTKDNLMDTWGYSCTIKRLKDKYAILDKPIKRDCLNIMDIGIPYNTKLNKEDVKNMLFMSKILSKTENGKNPEHKKIIDTVINAIK